MDSGGVMGTRVVTVNDLLNGHVALDIQCLDRVYLNAYVPTLQTSAQVVAFLSGHLGYPFPSPALFNQIGQRFRLAVASYADANDVPWIKFGKDDDKLAVMTPHLRRQAATGKSGVAAIGVAPTSAYADRSGIRQPPCAWRRTRIRECGESSLRRRPEFIARIPQRWLT
jgi:hypothetical protein